MIRPSALRRGDGVALISLASPPDTPDAISTAAKAVEELGFSTEIGSHATCRAAFLAGSDEDRIEDLHWAFSDPAIRGIFCIRGGYGTMRLLPRVNWELIRRNPKVFIGMSDITAIQLAILVHGPMVTFAGPMPLLSHQNGFTPYSRRRLLKVIGAHAWSPCRISGGPNDPKPVVVSPGKATGPLMGGNLHTLVSLIGTPFEPSFRDSLLVLEDVGEMPYRVDRLLTQLLLSGRIDGIAGVALGRFHGCYRESEDEIIDVLTERLAPLSVPVLYGLALGHQGDLATWPQGCIGELNCHRRVLRLLARGFEDP